MSEENKKLEVNDSRRKFIKKLAYIPPVVMTLHAVPSHATYGSGRHSYEGGSHEYDDDKKDNDYVHNDDNNYSNDKDKKSSGIGNFLSAIWNLIH